MKYLPFLFLFNILAFCACDKSESNTDTNASQVHKLEGKWTPVNMKITLKFSDGSTVNQTVPIKEGDYLEFVYQKTTGNKSEGSYKTRGVGFESTGMWRLEHSNNDLTFFSTATDGGNTEIYRKVESVTSNKLVLTADDRLVILWAEVNDLNQNETKKVTGGSAYEEYKK